MVLPSDPPKPVQSRASARGVLVNRLGLLVFLSALTVLSIHFNAQMKNLRTEVHTDEDKIKRLNNIVDSQAEVIERFADSVTNTDVVQRVDDLQDSLEKTEIDINQKLRSTEEGISAQLNQTLNQLDEIVRMAQGEIRAEVDKVKRDVDHYVRTTQDQFSMENSFMVYQLAGTFTLLGCLISMWHMTSHLRTFNQPFIQRKILAILWMCPIYSITSWLSLVFTNLEGYLAIIKDCYEAYVIYQFLSFLIAVLGKGNRDAVVDLLVRHPDHLHPPCGWCCGKKYDDNRSLAHAVLLQCQIYAMQFVLLRPLTSIAMFTLRKLGYYGAGNSVTDYRSPQFWIIGVQNVSVFMAFTGLLKFYHLVQDDLAWCRPWPKFLCIKGVVFMTFWQGLTISILAATTEIGGDEDTETWGKSAQNFLICLEMLLFAIAHFYVFPTEEWEEGYRPVENIDSKFGDNIALRDFLQDLKLIVGSTAGKGEKKRKKSLQKKSAASDDKHDGDEEQGNSSNEKDLDKLGSVNDATPDKEESLSGQSGGTGSDSENEEDEEDGSGERRLTISDIEDMDSKQKEATERLISKVSRSMRNIVASDDEDEMPRASSQQNVEEICADHARGAGDEEVGDDGLEAPNETTSLLGGAKVSNDSKKTSGDKLLRPSIFTTMGEMGNL